MNNDLRNFIVVPTLLNNAGLLSGEAAQANLKAVFDYKIKSHYAPILRLLCPD